MSVYSDFHEKHEMYAFQTEAKEKKIKKRKRSVEKKNLEGNRSKQLLHEKHDYFFGLSFEKEEEETIENLPNLSLYS